MNRLDELCAELDLAVLTDVSGDGVEAVASKLFALGGQADPEAGIARFVVTPWFAKVANLADYCDFNYDQIIEKGAPEC